MFKVERCERRIDPVERARFAAIYDFLFRSPV